MAKGRLQRLNRAVRPPGKARDDWEILRDLLQALGGGNGLYSIEDVFRRMSEAVPRFAGLELEQNRRPRRAHFANGRIAAAASQRRKSIARAVALQARRRAVRLQVQEARKAAAGRTHSEVNMDSFLSSLRC